VRASSSNATSANSNSISVNSLAAAPQAVNLSFTILNSSSFRVSWTATTNGVQYLVARHPGSPPSFSPVNGVDYTVGPNGADNISYVGSNTSFTEVNLIKNTNYYYTIYSFQGSGLTSEYNLVSPLLGLYKVLDESTKVTAIPVSTTSTSTTFITSGVTVTFPSGSSTGTTLTVNKTETQPASGAGFSLSAAGTSLLPLFFSIESSVQSAGTYTVVLDFSQLGLDDYSTFKVLKRQDENSLWEDVTQAPINAVITNRSTDGIPGKFTITGLTSFSQFGLGSAIFNGIVQSINIIEPQGGARFQGGTTQFISWNKKGSFSGVRLEYTTDNGNSWIQILPDGKDQPFPALTFYAWTIPNGVNSDQCGIKVSNWYNSKVFGTTDKFTIWDQKITTPEASAATGITTYSFMANWSGSAGATNYRLDVSTTSNFSSFITGYYNKDVGIVTSFIVSNLTSKTTYYFRVRAINLSGTSESSNIVSVTTHNQGPILNSIETANLIYSRGGSATKITNTIIVNDADNDSLSSAEIKITGHYQNGYDLLTFTDGSGITGNWDASTGTLNLTGTATLLNYQNALRSIYYSRIEGPVLNLYRRTIRFKINDGAAESNELFRVIDIGNTPPVLSGIESSAINYKQGDSPIVIANGISIADAGISNLVSAEVRISNNYKSDQDVLSFTPQEGISGTWDAAIGLLILRNTSSLPNYESVLRTVTYRCNSDSPDTLSRTISIKVSDPYYESNQIDRIINVSRRYNVFLTPSPSGGGTMTGGGTYDPGESVTLTATPSSGYSFASWTEHEKIVSTNPKFTFTINSTRSFVANFLVNQISVAAASSPSEGGTVSGFGTFNYGSAVKLIAVPNAGYDFTNWTENGKILSDSTSYTFTLTMNRALVANFTKVRVLSVSPLSFQATATSGTATITVSNTGGGQMNWSAVSNVFWVVITDGATGTNDGTVKIRYSANNSIARTGTITIIANGVIGSPKIIDLIQAARTFGEATDVEDLNLGIPDHYCLEQNYPNPFNPSTVIRYGLPNDSEVSITIYNVLGEEVAKIFNGAQGAGYHEISFNAATLTSGMYIYKINAVDNSSNRAISFTQTKKMLLVK